MFTVTSLAICQSQDARAMAVIETITSLNCDDCSHVYRGQSEMTVENSINLIEKLFVWFTFKLKRTQTEERKRGNKKVKNVEMISFQVGRETLWKKSSRCFFIKQKDIKCVWLLWKKCLWRIIAINFQSNPGFQAEISRKEILHGMFSN